MSRSGYDEGCEDNWSLIRYRGAVNSAVRGKKGQAFLRELLAVLDAMPEKRLIANDMQIDGEFCALGVVGHARGIDVENVDTWDVETLSNIFGIAESMAREIMYHNDEGIDEDYFTQVEICGPMQPGYPDFGRHLKTVRVPFDNLEERRWKYVHKWAESHLTLESDSKPKPQGEQS